MRHTILATLLACCAPLGAQPIIAQNSGLPNPDRIVDFGANLFANFTAITNQFPGLTIRHAAYFTIGSNNNLVGGFLTNDFRGQPDTLSIAFARPIRSLSFVYHQVGGGQPSLFRALLGGNVVASFANLSTQSQPNNYFGFANILFDELQLDFVADFNLDTLAIVDADATCTTRNGNGVNPLAYTCTNQPVIGTTWLAQIGRTINTVGTFLVVAPGGASPPVPFLNGELLVQVSPAPIVLAVPSSFGLGIPAQASNIGVTLATQGLRAENIGPAVVAQLLNAIDLRFGL
jgi:hypothetical protein